MSARGSPRSCSRAGTRSSPPRAISGRLAGFGWHDKVTGVALDADDATSVRAAFAAAGPVDVIYYLVHAIGQPGFRDRDNAAAANVAEAAKDAGVGRIVYLGGFVPDGDILSDHLAGRAEVADALTVDGGPEVVWLGAAVIIGAGSTSFEMVRYVGDRLLLIPLPPWAGYHMDPISIRDVLHYLVAAGDADRVTAGAYDLVGPGTTTYRGLLGTYVRATGALRAALPLSDWQQGLLPKALVARLAGVMVPVPTGLAADLLGSLDHPMTASDPLLRHYVPDPDGGLTSIEDAVAASLSGAHRYRSCAGGPASPGRQRPGVGRRGCAANPAGCRRGDTADGAAGARVVTHGPWTRGRRGANGPGHPHRPETEGAARMTAPGTQRRGLLNEIGAAITNVAVPHHEPPAVVLCRRIVVVIVLVIGAALLGFSLSRTPDESSFYWLTFALAAVWTVGAKLTSESASRAAATPSAVRTSK